MAGVTFVPAGDHTRVELAIQTLDETVVVTADKPYKTEDPNEISALDENSLVERKTATSKRTARKTGAPEPPSGDTPQEPAQAPEDA